MIYAQDAYLKFNKTTYNTALQLPMLPTLAEPTDVVLDFDWCSHMTGGGNIDKVTLTIIIEGNGTFENGTRYSEPLSNTQTKKKMFWTHATVNINGIDKDTKIVVVYTGCVNKETGKYTFNFKDEQHRYHLDNIRISK